MQLLIRIGLKSRKINDVELRQLQLQFRKWNLAGQEQSYPNCGEQVFGWMGGINELCKFTLRFIPQYSTWKKSQHINI